ncbi:glycosyltransferase family 1 protein [Micromonospora sp. CPCC 206060]|uniref:glycosyltransferase family 1 protein n=1 Tax=Micromonospora sp. CPCC 206060 TaxID=3122406 RepID=UPI002FEFB167
MTNVLIVAGDRPQQESVLVEALGRFRAQGARVGIVCDFALDGFTIDPALAELHSLRATEPDAKLRRTLARNQQPSRAVWLRAWHDGWVRQRVRTADVLVALDGLAVHTVWEMAQRQPRADACHGLGPAGKVIRARHEGTHRPARTGLGDVVSARAGILARGARRSAVTGVKESLEATMAPAVLRSRAGARLWRTVVAAPGLPDRVRGGLTYRLHVRAVRADRPGQAASASKAASARMADKRARAELLMREATEELAMGRVPVCLREAVTAELAVADDWLGRKNPRKAAQSLYKAMRLLFHRVPHFDQLTSPLAGDPAGFLAPLRGSRAAQALAAPRGREKPAATPPADRPLRLLIATNGNDHFLTDIRARYADLPGVELRYVHLTQDPVGDTLIRNAGAIVEHRLTGATEFGNRVEEWFRPHLDWADTVFVDWTVATAALLTLVDPGDTRVIMRLHSFEALSFWPHLIDFSRVDELLLVSEHLRDLAVEVLPALQGEQAPALPVIANAMDLRPYPRPKDPAARFTLGLIGTSAVAKDPRWAIEVLRELRAVDPRYRLLLIGSGLDPAASTSVRQYQDALDADLAELEPSGAVVRVGHTSDVPGALTGIGVILSSSVRESFHCALVEGAASGAVPVVRDWPFFAGRAHSARTLFPAGWVVGTPQEAAALIRTATATEESWRAAGEAASAYALATWDWSVTRHQFDELFRIPATEKVP